MTNQDTRMYKPHRCLNKRWRVGPSLCAILVASLCTPIWAEGLTVFAASSLKTALDEINHSYSADTGNSVTLSLAGSSTLARQIQHGAPADLYISANVAWMDLLQSKGLIVDASRFNLTANRLVLIAHKQRLRPIDLHDDTLVQALGSGRLAMALVDAVPAGIYGKQALMQLGLWPALSQRIAQTDNVRAALNLVASGEAPYGIVYATDHEPRIAVAATFATDTHSPILYPAAAVTGGNTTAANEYLSYLRKHRAQSVLRNLGFIAP